MRLLVVEDDVMLGEALQVGLRQQGFSVDWLKDGVAAQQALQTEPFAAMVLDLGLPRRSGIEVLQELRGQGGTLPVLILTARDRVEDRIGGLDAGADDYMIKPFDLGELAARLRALIRRASGSPSPLICIGPLQLDPVSHKVSFRGEDKPLSAREFAVLQELMRLPGRVISRQQLESRLYAWDEELESNAIDVYIHHLRRKLGSEVIRTLRGVGWFIPRELT